MPEQKRGRGQPPKPPEIAKTEPFGGYMTKAEMAMLRNCAASRQMGLSEYLRMAISEQIKRDMGWDTPSDGLSVIC